MNDCQELALAARELGLACQVLTEKEGAEYIERTLKRFTPGKVTGHLAIHHDSLSIPFGQYETIYPTFMEDEPTYIFFEQTRGNKDCVFILNEGKMLNKVLENSYRFEYFQSNANSEYLLAINWYVIEGTGSAIKWMQSLQN